MDVMIHQIRESAEELAARSRKLSACGEEIQRIGRYLAGLDGDEWSSFAASCARLSGRLSEESAGMGRHAAVLFGVADIYEAREKAAGRHGAKNLPAVREYPLDDVRKIVRRYTEMKME